MNTKLTLTIAQEVVESAKGYAKEKGQSLSDIVENYLKLNSKSYVRIILPVLALLFSVASFAQCNTWEALPDRHEVVNAYAVYRECVKNGDTDTAFRYWEIVYKNAPAADGQRSTVYEDGINFYLEKYRNAPNRKQKKALAGIILRLSEEQRNCYPESAAIPLPAELIK